MYIDVIDVYKIEIDYRYILHYKCNSIESALTTCGQPCIWIAYQRRTHYLILPRTVTLNYLTNIVLVW